MNENRKDFSKIPAAACTLVVGEFEIGDNGEKAKSAPVKLVARSGKPIEHWFWGRIVHDLAGMHLHKSRIPIDYVHDSKEVIGYLNRFDTESGDLVVSGALVPFKDSDRATEIVHKSRAGVPYEASINFGGDGLKVEDVMEGHSAQVNGFSFSGPGVIVREWPLRGVAICPYGADMNTDSSVLSQNNKVFAAAVISAPETTIKEGSIMSNPVEVVAKVETPAAPVVEMQKSVEAKPAEAAPVALAAEAPAASVEAKPSDKPAEVAPAALTAAVPSAPVEAKPAIELAECAKCKGTGKCPDCNGTGKMTGEVKAMTREEFVAISAKYGDVIAAKCMRDGGDMAKAMELHVADLEKENKRLHDRNAELETATASNGGTAAKVVAAQKPAQLFKTGK